MTSKLIELVKASIRPYPDFPKPGVCFQDLFGVYANPEASEALKCLLKHKAKELDGKVDAVIGLDARGFLLGPEMSWTLGVPFVPIRKKGKLPGDCLGTEYELEYGSASVEIQKTVFTERKIKRVVIVDDLLATGGTMAAAVKLVGECGAQVEECFVVIELKDLKGREKITGAKKISALIQM